MDVREMPERFSECCCASVTLRDGGPDTTSDALLTIHEADGTVSMAQPRIAWWICDYCGEKCDLYGNTLDA